MNSDPLMASHFVGCMIGVGLGDAIGELAFQHKDEADLCAEIAQQPTLIYTDDTAMTIGLAESLIAQEHIEPRHLGDTFRTHYKREPWRGYASGPPTIFTLVERRGGTYTDIAQALFEGQGSYGNGAAMRVAPVGLYFHAASDLYEQARRSAIVTHAHPIGIDGAAVLAKAIALALMLDPTAELPQDAFIQQLLNFAQTPEMREKLSVMEKLLAQNVAPMFAGMGLGQGIAAHESVPFAIYAFLRYPDSFEQCLFCAALNSGDRDTVAAMAGAISGAYLGSKVIPSAWREKLENLTTIENLALKLYTKR